MNDGTSGRDRYATQAANNATSVKATNATLLQESRDFQTTNISTSNTPDKSESSQHRHITSIEYYVPQDREEEYSIVAGGNSEANESTDLQTHHVSANLVEIIAIRHGNYQGTIIKRLLRLAF